MFEDYDYELDDKERDNCLLRYCGEQRPRN